MESLPCGARWRLRAALGLLLCLATASPRIAAAEPSRAQALTAAVVYKIAKFAAWPTEAAVAADGTFHLCYIGSASGLDEALEKLSGRQLDGREVRVQHIHTIEFPTRDCQLLFVTDVAATELADLLKPLKKRPVLTISDIQGFAAAGGMLELTRRNGKLGFIIHIGRQPRGWAAAGRTPAQARHPAR